MHFLRLLPQELGVWCADYDIAWDILTCPFRVPLSSAAPISDSLHRHTPWAAPGEDSCI